MTEIRELAAGRIKCAKKAPAPGEGKIRKFQCPSLNFEAAEYYCLLNWQDVPRTSPPMLRDINDDKIEAAIKVPRKWTLKKYPCHNQSVERHVKLVTEASSPVCGALRRDGYIRAKLESRKEIPHFGLKKDWKRGEIN
ncbi:hypothetical protein HELRODRAFT_171587 [Helobdella robusta]|uniref:Uncharacterized protein n=1 Tax=Helobdella robusta TaxID=6412 RepID=T1F4F6_HELRO|nr:hypothetical protein HELRODRAFT_171587 [Helobdella robusta]ESO05232.1 hypothetical protein HELRODRAFT_171587 [Helobdella robusta]